MKVNPIYKRETVSSSRNFRLALILLVFNGILAFLILLNLYSVVERVKLTAEIQYVSFTSLYEAVVMVEFVLLLFLMPAITAGSISGERERQTLDILLTTTMKPWEIIWGKFSASFSMLFLLVVSSFPLLAVSFVYGSLMVADVLLLLLCYGAAACLCGSMGICFSSVFKRSTLATAVCYGVLAFLIAGTYAVNALALSVAELNLGWGIGAGAGQVAARASSGPFLYLLLFNPASAFLVLLREQAGNGAGIGIVSGWFGPHQENFFLKNWAAVSIFIQLLLAASFLRISVRAISPEKDRKKRRT